MTVIWWGIAALVLACCWLVVAYALERRRLDRELEDTMFGPFDRMNEAFRSIGRPVGNLPPLIVTITADTAAFDRALRRASDKVSRIGEDMRWSMWLARQRTLARASAVIGVRAGLDPQYRTREQLHALVRQINDGRGRWWSFTPEERIELMVAAIHGWAHGWGRREPRHELADARRYGNSIVTVVAPTADQASPAPVGDRQEGTIRP